MSEIKTDSLEFDERLFGSDNDIDEHLKKSKTLMSEDSGIGIGTASQDDENPYLLSGGCCKMTRSKGIHSGLSEHTKPENPGKSQVGRFTSAFGQYLALAKRLRDSSLDSSAASSDEDCFVEDDDNLVEEKCIPIKLEDNKENQSQDINVDSAIFERGMKCEDVETALKILKTRYLLRDINIKFYHAKRVESYYPPTTPNFIDSTAWQDQHFETQMSMTLREVKEEIELRSKEIAGIAKMILKRHQDVMDEERKLIEIKKLKQDIKEPKINQPPSVAPKPSVIETPARRRSKNPLGRVFQSMKRLIVRRDKMARA